MRYEIFPEDSKGCFFLMLDDAMASNEIGAKKLETLLLSKGIKDISYKRISDYRLGNSTPSFEKAKTLLQVLGVEITDDELLQALKKNKEKIKRDKDELYFESEYKSIKISARIKLRKLIPGKTASETKNILDDRIMELYGDKTKMSLYIQGLISKDLIEGLINKEDVEVED